MIRFFFNHECIPKNCDFHAFLSAFEKSITAFSELSAQKEYSIEANILTDKMPSELSIGLTFKLDEALENISNKNLKRLAFSYFTKYPIEDHLDEKWDAHFEDAGNCVYEIEDGESTSAFYSYLAGTQGLFSLTSAVSDNLKVNQLEIKTGNKIALTLVSLFGGKDNMDFVSKEIKNQISQKLDLFGQLVFLFDCLEYLPSFEKSFNQLPNSDQESIIEHFKRATNRDTETPFSPDGDLIKSTIVPDKNKSKVYELRVRSPNEIRVYFLEQDGCVFLASICKKSNPDQSKDIKQAQNIIYRMLITK